MALEVGAPPVGIIKEARRRRRRWFLVAAVVLAAGLIGSGIAAVRWLHGLNVFAPSGASVAGSIPVGQTLYAFVTDATGRTHAPTTVDLRAVNAHIVLNTAEASVRVAMCKENGGIVVFGATRHVASYCGSLHRFAAGTYRFSEDSPSTAIVLVITAHRPGLVRIDGVDVTYQAGIRQGKQNTGISMTYRAVTK